MKKKTIVICLISVFIVIIGFILFLTSKYAITLNGSEKVDVEVGSTYNELGARPILNLSKIKIEGNVDTSKIGTYEIKYNYLYSYITRTVNVVDTKEPVINLEGNLEINLVKDGTYVEPGFNAYDEYDGDLTANVVVSNNINTKESGSYEVLYQVEDSSGNKTTVSRKISVNEKGPMSMNLQEFTLDGYFDTTILKESKRVDDSYINETVFYGDSITDNFAYYGSLPWSVTWSKSSVTPENAHTWTVPIRPYGVEMTLVDALKTYTPKRLIITLGANAVAVMTENYFIKTYEDLIVKAKEASPNTLFIVQSIFPVDIKWDTHANTQNSINNTKINRLNYLLVEMCERQGIKFLNTATVLKDENGRCRYGYCYYSDGIHLLPDGNNQVMEYIKTHAYIEGE